jgi:hypothetical protein
MASYFFNDFQSELGYRGQVTLVYYINSVQQLEKEKLTLYAAKHIDEIQAGSTVVQPHMPTTAQNDYNASALRKLEDAISEALEGLQSEKCDLLQNEDDQDASKEDS